MSSDTPLTDAKVFLTRGPGFNSVDPNFARTLERRVSQLEAELQSAEQVIEKSAGQPGSYLYTQRLEKRVTQLEAQLAEARKDSERLDWLQAQEVKHALETNTHGPDFDYLVLSEDGATCWGKTYRAAIDAAMKP